MNSINYITFRKREIVIFSILTMLNSILAPIVIKSFGVIEIDAVTLLEFIVSLVPLIGIKLSYSKVSNLKQILLLFYLISAISNAFLFFLSQIESLSILGYGLYVYFMINIVIQIIRDENRTHYEHVNVLRVGKHALRLLRKKAHLLVTYSTIIGSLISLLAINLLYINVFLLAKIVFFGNVVCCSIMVYLLEKYEFD